MGCGKEFSFKYYIHYRVWVYVVCVIIVFSNGMFGYNVKKWKKNQKQKKQVHVYKLGLLCFGYCFKTKFPIIKLPCYVIPYQKLFAMRENLYTVSHIQIVVINLKIPNISLKALIFTWEFSLGQLVLEHICTFDILNIY